MRVSQLDIHWSTCSVEQISAYCDRLYGRRLGIVVVVLGVNGRYSGAKDTYKFASASLPRRFFEWPREREKLFEIVKLAHVHDLYVLPTLRSARNARKGSCLGSEYIWADVDHVDETTWRKLARISSDSSFLVHSGRGLHVYIKLDSWYPADVIEKLNNQLMHYLGADSKWAENALLRLPGTINHKLRAQGKTLPVVFEDLPHTGIAPWAPTALSRLLGPAPASREPSGRSKGVRKPRARRERTPAAEIPQIEPEESIPPHVLQRIHQELDALGWPRRKGGDNSESARLHGVIGHMMVMGLSDARIVAAALSYGPLRTKWKSDSDLRREVQRSISKLRTQHPHEGLTCQQVGCRSMENSTVGSGLAVIREHYQANYRSSAPASDSKIFDAFTRLVIKNGRFEVNASERQLCELASIGSCNTVAAALRRLEAAGYLKKIRQAHGTPVRRGTGQVNRRSHRYRLNCPAKEPNDAAIIPDQEERGNHPHHAGDNIEPLGHSKEKEREGGTRVKNGVDQGNQAAVVEPEQVDLLDPALDMWRHGGGLSSARLTYALLLEGLNTQSEMAEARGQDPKTILRHLKKLANVGLAQKQLDGTWVALFRSPDEVAEEIGTLGMGERQAEHHAWETERFKEHLELRQDEDDYEWGQLLAAGHEQVGRCLEILAPPGTIARMRAAGLA
jgi:DNA-binding MarR family transcriptional regulator